ncbi:hypothetical protein [Nitratireductor sp. ZSWI3]|uniref:hypothetical protein n=1 Tax=Nitratireductor sp. ZSWI3 TaxID=2966359 RepID=UPI00214FEC07|nr:hypothetical protein [Nitratireductor sp. ZSWI3]MCR4264685.1 hypothetical protein [Nitratireductor sp. ZSWI3]
MTVPRKQLDHMSKKVTEDYLRRSSITYLECCISLMLTHLAAEEVARVLEQEARFIRDLD